MDKHTKERIERSKKDKIRVIKDIDTGLTLGGQQHLSTQDFDTLYDLEIDELMQARFEIENQLAKLKKAKEVSS